MQEIVDRKKTRSARSLSKRVAALEAQVAELKQLEANRPQPVRAKDWRRTVGMFADDPTYDEALRLGRAWRRRQPKC